MSRWKYKIFILILLIVIPFNYIYGFLYSAASLFGQFNDSFNLVFTNNHIDNVSEPNQRGIDFSTSIAVDTVNHRLFVSDSDNARVLVFQLDSSDMPSTTTASYVLGQPGFYTETQNATRNGMAFPSGLAYDQTNMILYVADEVNNRITTYDVNPLTISNGENAINVLGQLDFTSSSQTTTQSGLNSPRSLSLDSGLGRLYVADQQNNRVMVFDVASITDGENAIKVLGQLDFISSGQATTQGGLKNPSSVLIDTSGNRLFVADELNHRVVVYDVLAITDGENAIKVLGQLDFTTSTQATLRNKMSYPEGVAYDQATHTLYVSDSGNNRVLTFDVLAITDGENAVNVLGQLDFTSSLFLVTQSNLSSNFEIAINPATGKLFVSDTSGFRIGIFDISTIIDGENMVGIIGQYSDDDTINYTKSGKNNRSFPNSFGFNYPAGSVLDSKNHRLFIDDCSNNRVVVFQLDSTNSMSSARASHVLGQPNLNSRSTHTTINGMDCPFGGPAYDSQNERLFVSDYFNNRVLVFNVDPGTISNGENATNVLGQTDFTTSAGGTTKTKLRAPNSLVYDSVNNRLFVSERNNNRITVFNVNPGTIIDGEEAVNVLGQTDFVTSAGGTTRINLDNPNSVAYDSVDKRLFVADGNNNRVLVFDANPGTIIDGAQATHVIGHTDYVTSAGGTTQNTLSSPNGLAFDTLTNRLFVSDDFNNRLLSFKVSTTSISSGLNAEEVIGQTDYSTSNSNTTQTGLNDPEGNIAIDLENRKMFVSDSSNNRVIVFTLPKVTTDASLPTADSGSSYTKNIAVSQYQGTLSYSVAGGSMPSGLSLDSSTGDISGTPTASGNFNFKIEVSDNSSSGKLVGSKDFSLTVNSAGGSSGGSSGGGGGVPANGPIFEQPKNKVSTTTPSEKNKPVAPGVTSEGKLKNFSYEGLSCPYFTKQLKLGSTDVQVKAVQSFLIYYGYMKYRQTDNYFDLETEVAVKKFQKDYSSEILIPWGHSTPTGWWYITTRKKANEITDCVTHGTLEIIGNSKNIIDIHSTPNSLSRVIGGVNSGEQFNYYDKYKNWYYIDFLNTKSGWLKSENIEIIDRTLFED